MTRQELDEFIYQYGETNKTDVEDIKVAMTITKIRKDKENGYTL